MKSPEAGSAPSTRAEEVESLRARLAETEKKLAQTEAKLALAEANVRIDHLTGLRNRKALDEELDQNLGRFRRDLQEEGGAKPISFILVDLDHFKRVNDEYGHQAGDEVLMTAAAVIQESVRTTDTVARYGGEEIGVVLYGADAKGAEKVAEEIRTNLAKHDFLYKNTKIPITASLGVSVASKESEADVKQLIHRADKALYDAKSNGRDCVVISG